MTAPTFSNADLKAIRIAERDQYERVFALASIAVTLYRCFNLLNLLQPNERLLWVEERALEAVDAWRSHFCPSRVGLPYESEWPTGDSNHDVTCS